MRRWVAALWLMPACNWLVPSHGVSSDAGGLGGDGPNQTGGLDAPSAACSRGLSGSDCPRSLTAGAGETCALGSGGLYCWGQEVPGEVTDIDHPVLYSFSDTIDAVQLATTTDGINPDALGCFRSKNGLWCWGNDYFDQLQSSGGSILLTPMMMTVVGVQQFAVGADHVCVVSSSEPTVECWGRSDMNQLDDNDLSGESYTCDTIACTPTAVSGSNAMTTGQMVAGRSHTCISPNSYNSTSAACWGDNRDAQLGNPASGSNDLAVVIIAENSQALDMADGFALGANHSCAIVGAETFCWGDNSAGQLGTNVSGMIREATPVSTTARMVAIAAGTATTCAIDMNRQVWCWGANDRGQAGQGSASGPSPMNLAEPTQVAGLDDAIEIAVGDNHACAVRADGDIVCWGDNSHHELGDGGMTHMQCGSVDCSWQPVTVVTP